MTWFVYGAVMMGFLVIATFFLRSWRRTNDRLFGWFALSFFLMALERFLILITDAQETSTPWVYLLRLAAFALIALAIIDKNRKR